LLQTGIMLNLVLALAVATAGGVVAVWLKRPVIIGYLVAGVILGPFTPGPEADAEDLNFLAEVGVALLLFVTGSSLNPSRFVGLGWVVLVGGAI
jgi:CPA2 family monovalent cation:H+ antiporter-2